MTPPPILTSPKTSLIMLLTLTMVLIRSQTMNSQMLDLNAELATAEWRIRHGSQHRIDLLQQIDTAGLKGKQLTEE